MTAGDFYRVEFRIQNSVQKYYLVREIFSDARKFSASRLITSGTPPTRTEINRCASLYGFDLELKCIAKAAKYRSEVYRYDTYDDVDDIIELERFRLLVSRRMQLSHDDCLASYIASYTDVTFTTEEISTMLETGKIPAGKTLLSVNLVQNIANAWKMREKRLTISSLYKLHSILAANVQEPLASTHRPALEKRIHEFSRKIKDDFYPFEQCVYLYQDIQEMLPDEHLFASSVYTMVLSSFGYLFFPKDAATFEEAVLFAKEQNPQLEREVRRLNEAMFTVKAGGKQKQLELF